MMSSKSLNTNVRDVGGYTLLIMVYDGEDVLKDRVTITNRHPTPTHIIEFTPKSMEELGKNMRFKVYDATSYVPGMDTLSLLVSVNGEEATKKLSFPVALTNMNRAVEFRVSFYKSVIISFDLQTMRNRMLV